jgi:hypothetical protein
MAIGLTNVAAGIGGFVMHGHLARQPVPPPAMSTASTLKNGRATSVFARCDRRAVPRALGRTRRPLASIGRAHHRSGYYLVARVGSAQGRRSSPSATGAVLHMRCLNPDAWTCAIEIEIEFAHQSARALEVLPICSLRCRAIMFRHLYT